MSRTATSPQSATHHSSLRPTTSTPTVRQQHHTSTTPSTRQQQQQQHHNSSNMPPLFSPRLPTPQQPAAQSAKSPSPNYFGLQSHDSGGFMSDAQPHARQNWVSPSSGHPFHRRSLAQRHTPRPEPRIRGLHEAFTRKGFPSGRLQRRCQQLQHECSTTSAYRRKSYAHT